MSYQEVVSRQGGFSAKKPVSGQQRGVG